MTAVDNKQIKIICSAEASFNRDPAPLITVVYN
jgi:hypothetical protein